MKTTFLCSPKRRTGPPPWCSSFHAVVSLPAGAILCRWFSVSMRRASVSLLMSEQRRPDVGPRWQTHKDTRTFLRRCRSRVHLHTCTGPASSQHTPRLFPLRFSNRRRLTCWFQVEVYRPAVHKRASAAPRRPGQSHVVSWRHLQVGTESSGALQTQSYRPGPHLNLLAGQPSSDHVVTSFLLLCVLFEGAEWTGLCRRGFPGRRIHHSLQRRPQLLLYPSQA